MTVGGSSGSALDHKCNITEIINNKNSPRPTLKREINKNEVVLNCTLLIHVSPCTGPTREILTRLFLEGRGYLNVSHCKVILATKKKRVKLLDDTRHFSKFVPLSYIILTLMWASLLQRYWLLFSEQRLWNLNLWHLLVHIQDTHRLYKQKLEEVTKLQNSCTSAISRQRKKLKELTVSLRE